MNDDQFLDPELMQLLGAIARYVGVLLLAALAAALIFTI
jgi:hypothetical protein